MNSKFYVTYDVRIKDGQIEHRGTSFLDNKQDADFIFDGRAEDPEIISLELWQVIHRQPEEMARPDYHPRGFDEWRLVRMFAKE